MRLQCESAHNKVVVHRYSQLIIHANYILAKDDMTKACSQLQAQLLILLLHVVHVATRSRKYLHLRFLLTSNYGHSLLRTTPLSCTHKKREKEKLASVRQVCNSCMGVKMVGMLRPLNAASDSCLSNGSMSTSSLKMPPVFRALQLVYGFEN